MARYRGELDDDRGDRELRPQEERSRRETPGANEEPWSSRRELESRRHPYYNRYGERADYEYDEPRYGGRERYREEEYRGSALYEGRGSLAPRYSRERYAPARSRLRCRDIMTRDLAVSTRDSTLREVAIMMKQEDTGVIPVVDYDKNGGNGSAETRNADSRQYSRGKLVGLITDRDISVRAVAEGKDCTATKAEEIMSTDIHTARPNDRIVDVIRKMGDKQVRRIPITNENGYLVGMISTADIALETHDDTELAEAIEEISKGSSFWSRLFG